MPNKKYLCIQRSEPSEQRQPSPAQIEEMYGKFHAWMEKFKNNIADMGGKLGGGAVVTSKGATDGPFVETKEVIGGFMIVSAKNLEEAMEVVRESPASSCLGRALKSGKFTLPELGIVGTVGVRSKHLHLCCRGRDQRIVESLHRKQVKTLSSFTTAASIETRSRPRLLAATRHGFTFYVADPVSSIHEHGSQKLRA